MIPPLPPARSPNQDGGRATILPRYEDITQDARLQLLALMPGVGATIFGALLSKLPAVEALRAQGILPILRRMVATAEDRNVSVHVPLAFEGAFRFAREKDGERLLLNAWLEARAPIATTLGGAPAADAPSELVGRVFAEHVLTRPFAPPGERKVTRLDAPGVPAVPEDEYAIDTAEALVEGMALEDAGDVRFGMMHTDSNQHVNSLVYLRAFEELAVRRLGNAQLLARGMDLRWRKPFFAGETTRVTMAVEGATAVGAFLGAEDKVHATIKLLFR
jgi:hypothetical protein